MLVHLTMYIILYIIKKSFNINFRYTVRCIDEMEDLITTIRSSASSNQKIKEALRFTEH
jgi:hypothetical protein